MGLKFWLTTVLISGCDDVGCRKNTDGMTTYSTKTNESAILIRRFDDQTTIKIEITPAPKVVQLLPLVTPLAITPETKPKLKTAEKEP